MVSSALRIDLQDLLETLQRIRREHGDDPAYQEVRGALPGEWPM